MLKKIMRDWRVKVLAQNVIGLLPNSLSFPLNEIFIRLVRGTSSERINTAPRILKGLDNLRLLQVQGGFHPSEATILELGTGWHGIDLILFYVLGAEHVYTVDYSRNLTLKYVQAQLPYFSNPEILEQLESFSAGASARVEYLQLCAKQSVSLDDLLKQMCVTYFIIDSGKFDTLAIEQQAISLFYVESVLQRIPEKNLEKLLSHVSAHLAAPNSMFFFRTDQKDINSQEHVDRNLWELDYLKYSDTVFKVFLSGKFNNQNRLRESDFLALIEASGMSVTFVESGYRESDLERIRSMKVAKRFQQKESLDLVTLQSKIIGHLRRQSSKQEFTHRFIKL